MKKVLSVGAAIAVSGTLAYSAEAASHTVDTGDTIWGLAQENNTSIDAIKSENSLTSDLLIPGQVLEINGTDEEAEETAETSEDGTYTIQAGDTLFEIAQKFDVSVSDLKAWNNLSSDLIFAGKTLTVSGENVEEAPVQEEAPQVEEAAPVQEEAPQVEEAAPVQEETNNQAAEAAAAEQAAAEQQAAEQAAAEQRAAEEAAQQEQQAAEQAAQQEQQEQQQVQTQSVSTSSNSSSGNNWGALAQCESGGDAGVVSANGLYHGLYQFDVQTWNSVGGSGLPSQASAAEQTQRAEMLYDQRGSQPWPVCGSRL